MCERAGLVSSVLAAQHDATTGRAPWHATHLQLLQLRLRNPTTFRHVATSGTAAEEGRWQQAAALLARLTQLTHLIAQGAGFRRGVSSRGNEGRARPQQAGGERRSWRDGVAKAVPWMVPSVRRRPPLALVSLWRLGYSATRLLGYSGYSATRATRPTRLLGLLGYSATTRRLCRGRTPASAK